MIRQLGKDKYQLIVDYYDEDGNRRKHTKTVTCKGKKEASKLYDEFADSWEDALPEDMTVSQLVEDYIESRAIKGIKPNTIQGYESVRKRFDADGLGKKSARNLTTYQIEKYIINCVKEDGLSGKTIKNMVSLLNSSYKMAIRTGLLRENPCEHVELPKVKKPEINIMSDDDISVFVTKLQDLDLDRKVLCELALFLGMRRGEIMGLRVGDIDFAAGSIHVTHTRYLINGEMVVAGTKTDRPRTLACPDFILDDIKALIAEHEEVTDCDYIIQYLGEPMKPDYASKAVTKFVDGLGMPHVTLHGLRHTFASMLNASMDFDIAEISSALGHSNISTTMNIYVDVFNGATRSSQRISDSMEKKYGKNGAKNGANAK